MSETLTIPVRALLRLHEGFNGLDGVKPNATETLLFEFDPGVKWNLVKNAGIVEAAKDAYDKSLRKLIADSKLVNGEPVTDKNRDAIIALQTAQDASKDSEVKLEGILFIDLTAIFNKRKAKDGKTEIVNQIPVSILKNLALLIKEEPATA